MAWTNGGRTRTTTAQHRAWRTTVLNRDGWTCQIQDHGCTGDATQADHIHNVADGGAEYDPANGQAVCENCHKKKTAREAHKARNAWKRGNAGHPGIL